MALPPSHCMSRVLSKNPKVSDTQAKEKSSHITLECGIHVRAKVH